MREAQIMLFIIFLFKLQIDMGCLRKIVIINVFAFILQEKSAVHNIDESWSQLAAGVLYISSTDDLR